MSNTVRNNRFNRYRYYTPSYLSAVADVYSSLTKNTFSCALVLFSSFSLLCLSFGDYSPFSLLSKSLSRISVDESLSSAHRITAYILNFFFLPFLSYQYIASLVFLIFGFLTFSSSLTLITTYSFVFVLFTVLSFSPTVSLIYFHILFLFPKLFYSRHKYITLFFLFIFILLDFVQQLAVVNIHLLSPVNRKND